MRNRLIRLSQNSHAVPVRHNSTPRQHPSLCCHPAAQRSEAEGSAVSLGLSIPATPDYATNLRTRRRANHRRAGSTLLHPTHLPHPGCHSERSKAKPRNLQFAGGLSMPATNDYAKPEESYGLNESRRDGSTRLHPTPTPHPLLSSRRAAKRSRGICGYPRSQHTRHT
jgi:hypothetical protein